MGAGQFQAHRVRATHAALTDKTVCVWSGERGPDGALEHRHAPQMCLQHINAESEVAAPQQGAHHTSVPAFLA